MIQSEVQPRLPSVVKLIKGIVAIGLVPGEDGQPAEVRVLASGARNPRHLVRDVVSALTAETGIEIAPEQVRLFLMEDEPAEEGPNRIRLVGARVDQSGVRAEAKVRLGIEGDVLDGVAIGGNTERTRLRLVAEATVAALTNFFRSGSLMAVEDVTVAPVGSQKLALTSVAMAGRKGQIFSGASAIRGDEAQAVARATLDALNRQIRLIALGE
ncbi:MAG: hypothetical protein M1598_09195 [Actinobacteria bacterium]|nr:hypothetical protein [Actinomycetota bacterium]